MSDKFEGLKEKLEELNFPTKYMYKFIVTADRVHELNPYFEMAEITVKESKKGTYVSFSAIEMAISADHIIDKYKSLSHIKNIISL